MSNFSKWLQWSFFKYNFALWLAMYESFSCPISLPTLETISPFNVNHSSGYAVATQSGFKSTILLFAFHLPIFNLFPFPYVSLMFLPSFGFTDLLFYSIPQHTSNDLWSRPMAYDSKDFIHSVGTRFTSSSTKLKWIYRTWSHMVKKEIARVCIKERELVELGVREAQMWKPSCKFNCLF